MQDLKENWKGLSVFVIVFYSLFALAFAVQDPTAWDLSHLYY